MMSERHNLVPEGYIDPLMVDPRNVPTMVLTTAVLVNKLAKMVANEGEVSMVMLKDAIAQQDAALVPFRKPANT